MEDVQDIESEEDFLDFMEKNMYTFAEDQLEHCLDENQIIDLIHHETKDITKQISRLYIMVLVLYSVVFISILAFLSYQLWKKSKRKKDDDEINLLNQSHSQGNNFAAKPDTYSNNEHVENSYSFPDEPEKCK